MKKSKEIATLATVLALVAFIARIQFTEHSNPTLTQAYDPPSRSVLLVGLDSDQALTQWCAEELRIRTGAQVRVLEAYDALSNNYNLERRQYDASEIINKLSTVPRGEQEILIGVTEQDLFLSEKPEWRYCFGSHGDKVGVISLYRMQPEHLSQSRYLKMLLRYVLEMAYELKRRDDPKSLLHTVVLSPSDLDTMEFKI